MQKTEVNAEDSYKLYKEISEAPVEKRAYLDIGAGYRQFLMDKVFEGEEVTLPAKTGTLAIIGTKKKIKLNKDGIPMLPPNWRKTKELWDSNPEAKATRKLIFCTNEETSGVVYKLHWSKNRIPLENKKVYALRLVRKNKRAISVLIKQGKEYLIRNT